MTNPFARICEYVRPRDQVQNARITTAILPTRNEALGFCEGMRKVGVDPMKAWNAASAMIAAEIESSPEGVRDFLDSRHGRRFAEDIASVKAEFSVLENAIEATIARWHIVESGEIIRILRGPTMSVNEDIIGHL